MTEENKFNVKDRGAIVVGAQDALGMALVKVLIEQGASKVYATASDKNTLNSEVFEHEKVVRMQLNVCDMDDISKKLEPLHDVSLIINNASYYAYKNGIFDCDIKVAEKAMKVHYLAPLRVAQAFETVLKDPRRSAIVNICCISSLMNIVGSTFSASKASTHSLTQALRRELSKTCLVVGVYQGPVDADEVKSLDARKTSAKEASDAIVQALLDGTEEIFPDELSKQLLAGMRRNPNRMEHKFAGYQEARDKISKAYEEQLTPSKSSPRRTL